MRNSQESFPSSSPAHPFSHIPPLVPLGQLFRFCSSLPRRELGYSCLSTCCCVPALQTQTWGKPGSVLPGSETVKGRKAAKQVSRQLYSRALQNTNSFSTLCFSPTTLSCSALSCTPQRSKKYYCPTHTNSLFPFKKHTFSNSVLFCNKESV